MLWYLASFSKFLRAATLCCYVVPPIPRAEFFKASNFILDIMFWDLGVISDDTEVGTDACAPPPAVAACSIEVLSNLRTWLLYSLSAFCRAWFVLREGSDIWFWFRLRVCRELCS